MHLSRRNLIGLTPALMLASRKVLAGQLQATPSQFEGPYYPVVPIPLKADLVSGSSDRADGTVMTLAGQVLNRTGKALPGILVEIWQCDAAGRYRHPGAPETGKVDGNFAGFGAAVTDTNGRYRFITIMPVPYTGRPPHIHVKLYRAGTEKLTTQLYLAGQEKENGVFMRLMARQYGNRRQLLIKPKQENEELIAVYDFVLA